MGINLKGRFPLPLSLSKHALSPSKGDASALIDRLENRDPGVLTEVERPSSTRTTRFGLAADEVRFLRNLRPAWRIQKFLDAIDYDLDGRRCRSPRRVLRERTAQCLDGALFAAAALRLHGHPPLIMDLEATRDDDHVLAIFKQHGRWGAIAKSNYSGLRYREPVFRTLRELALSYFEVYFNLRGEKTLRQYSVPLDLSQFDQRQWMTEDDDQGEVATRLVHLRHFSLLTPTMERNLGRVDRRLYQAGMVGRRTRRRDPDAG